jgi:formylglycine-generating enzyme required for sulfatase activity
MRGLRAILALGAFGGAIASCELAIDTSHLDSETDASVPPGDGSRSDATMPREGGDRGAKDVANRDGPSDVRSEAPSDAPAVDALCPGEAGPAMVRVGAYCIDSTEVTGADYLLFVDADAGASLEPPQCSWKKGRYDNGGSWTIATNGPNGPAGYVDWCDAYVYCKWAGKRLCGNIGGGSVPYGAYADPKRDQWFAACEGRDATNYPYGNTFDPTACNGLLTDGSYPDGATMYTVEPVKSRITCQGGYPGIFDMSGNAAEWEDCCDESEGGDASAQPCRYRGGSANSDKAELECTSGMSFGSVYRRSSGTDDLGFRCCSP